ncbi:MAG TPA: HAD family hydrolase [Dehalococcoidia bacterium]|nr:HAD family hydrolase [Dehalococcoidia bacterium]
MLDAVLFDLDGTLIDSAAVTAAAIIETLADFGCCVTLEQIQANGGRALRGWFTGDLDLAPDVAEAAYWRYVDTMTARAAISSPMPGAGPLLEALQRRGVPMALVTNRLTRIVLPIIQAAGWSGYFTVIVGQETAARTKPAPDPALYALEALGVPAGRAALIGDSEAGIRCGASAGIGLLIGLADERVAPTLTEAGVTHICRTLDEVRNILLSMIAIASAPSRSRLP